MRTSKETLQIAVPGIIQLAYSPADSFLVICEKHNPTIPGGHNNLQILNAASGKTLAKFEWKKNPKEAIKSIKFSADESYCARLVPQQAADKMNAIEIYENSDFTKPTKVIKSRFQIKPPKKQEPAIFAEGHFDGFEIGPLNPNVPREESPAYIFTWQTAGLMTEEEENGTVYVYDMRETTFEKQKFTVKCHSGQEIRVKISRTGHAMLIWSNSLEDRTHKSYYGEH